jgi:hypothetical protein
MLLGYREYSTQRLLDYLNNNSNTLHNKNC